MIFLKLRHNRLLNLLVINLRYVIGFGFVPSGLIKVMDKPFTRIENVGVFYDFLDALYATGFYYNMVGFMQVFAAVLLITQRFSTVGAAVFLPIIFNITVLTLSTIGSFTPLIATLMLLGTISLLVWDQHKWINIFSPDNHLKTIPVNNDFPTFQKVHIYTGLFLLGLPCFFFFIGWKETALFSAPIVLIVGNIISEMKYPVLRYLFKKTFLRPLREDVQKS